MGSILDINRYLLGYTDLNVHKSFIYMSVSTDRNINHPKYNCVLYIYM